MLSGIAVTAKALRPRIRVIAAEPCGVNDAADVAASKAAGRLLTDVPRPATIADGLQGAAPQRARRRGAPGAFLRRRATPWHARPPAAHPHPAARLGQHTWPVVRDLVDAVVVVSESEILAAMRLVMERMKLVVEPSGAVGLAAVLSPDFAAAAGCGQRPAELRDLDVGVILCGGNFDFESKGFFRPELWQPQA